MFRGELFPQKPACRGKAVVLALLFLISALLAPAQSQQPQSSSSKPQQQQPQSTPAQGPPAEAGGPQGEVGPIAVPKKKEEPPPEQARPKKNPEGMPEYSVRVDVPLVTLDVLVTTKDGYFIPGLKKDNFQVFEDGQPQRVSNFSQSEAPITAVLLIEFAATNYYFIRDALNASYTFADGLKPNDWVAVIDYDMKPHLTVDFTQDKKAIYGALNTLRIPGFSETNLFDALYDTLDRLDRIEGRKYIILISSGRDTFSRLTFDKILKKVQSTPNVTIFSISTGEALREWIDARYGARSDVREAMMDFQVADNEMNTFAKMTGGRWYHPRFTGEFADIFRDVSSSIRNQYILAYHPTNTKLDGTYRKLKVEVVAPNGGPLKVVNEKGKPVKYQVIAREGYTAKHTVE